MTFPIYGKIKFMFQTTNQLYSCASQALVPSCSQQDNCHFKLFVYQYESYIIYPHYKRHYLLLITFPPFCPPNRDFQHMVILSKPWHPNGTLAIPSWYSWMFNSPYIPSFIAKSTHPHISTIFQPLSTMFPPYFHHISTIFHHISTIFQPFSTMFPPYFHHMSTMFPPYFHHISTIFHHISTIFQPFSTMFPPYFHHISTVFHHTTIFPHCAELRKWCSAAVAKVAVDPPRRECRARPAACSALGCRNHGQFLRENNDQP